MNYRSFYNGYIDVYKHFNVDHNFVKKASFIRSVLDFLGENDYLRSFLLGAMLGGGSGYFWGNKESNPLLNIAVGALTGGVGGLLLQRYMPYDQVRNRVDAAAKNRAALYHDEMLRYKRMADFYRKNLQNDIKQYEQDIVNIFGKEPNYDNQFLQHNFKNIIRPVTINKNTAFV